MTTGYVVSEVGFEYNDEIYHQSESGGGEPIKVFLDKNKANELVHQKNVEAFSKNNIMEYTYEPSDIFDDEEAVNKICQKYGLSEGLSLSDDSYEFGEWLQDNFKNFSQKDQEKIMKMANIEFFSITEVEFDDTFAPVPEKKEKKKFGKLN